MLLFGSQIEILIAAKITWSNSSWRNWIHVYLKTETVDIT